MNQVAQFDQTVFSTPTRWAIRVLAWLAFFVAAYLAWNALHGTSVAGCGAGTQTDCDIVLTSSWSKWLGVPVAFVGLACFASLAALSVMLGLTGPRNGRWVDTLVVMLSIAAMGAGLWFIGVQLFAIGHICRYCMVVDVIGIAVGGLTIWTVVSCMSTVSSARAADKGLMALRTMTAPRTAAAPLLPKAATMRAPQGPGRPAIALALGGAFALVALLIGGQILRPSKTYARQQNVALETPIDLTSTAAADSQTKPADSTTAHEHVAMRVPTESAVSDDAKADDDDKSADFQPPADSDSEATAAPPPSEAAPQRKRLVKFLNGTLTLDVYEHPVLGNPEAPHVMVEMVSYDCPHCRKMHKTVQSGLRRYGDQLAIILLMLPLESKCNRLVTDPSASHAGACTTARMALGVAALKPRAFQAFHDWLMADKDKPPSQDKIVVKAFGLVDRQRFRDLTRGDELNKKISQYVDLYAMFQGRKDSSKKFGLPVQIMGDEVMSGGAEDPDDVYEAWEKNLGIKPL